MKNAVRYIVKRKENDSYKTYKSTIEKGKQRNKSGVGFDLYFL